jgi:4-amino-4-deoxy-L-arabinose transferase-like glycosyltransferase
VLALAFSAAVRLRLESIPLERDEGEYAYAGQLILQGTPPYAQAYNMKFPGTYLTYAGIMAVFGETTEGIHRGFLLVGLATITLTFLIARAAAGDAAAATAAWVQAVLASSPAFLALAGHATHLVILPMLGGLLLLIGPGSPTVGRTATAGVFFGLAVLMKQPGALFVPLGLALVCARCRKTDGARWRAMTGHALLFLAAALTPHVLTWAWLAQAGVFSRYWFWTITYAREYGSILSLAEGASALRQTLASLMSPTAPVWVLAAIGLSALAWHVPLRRQAPFLGGWLLVSFLAVCPGLYFRDHYFIVMIPVLAVLAGAGLQAGVGPLVRRLGLKPGFLIPGCVAAACLGWPVWSERALLFTASPTEASRRMYGINPFVESPVIAAYIRDHSPADATIAVIGSEPQIYFHAGRRSATGYIYTYALMEPQPFAVEMQREMIREIEAARPQFLVSVRIPTSWLVRPASSGEIFSWFERYSLSEYSLVGVVDMHTPDATTYHWDGDVWRHPERHACEIEVWKRRDAR